MRKVLISLLLASAAASPALAERPNFSDPQQTREERQQAREDRQSAREERSSSNQSQSDNRAERPQRNAEPRQQTQESQQSFQGQQQQPQRSIERPAQSNFNARVVNNPNVEAFRERQRDRSEVRADRQQQLRDNRELRQSNRPTPPVLHTRTPVVSNVPRPGTQPPLRVERNHAPIQWSSNWRHNGKYDWQNHRRHHRSIFHLGFYYDPFGWGYNPFQIGWRMWPSYYSSNFWINDPWYYRLPYAPPGTRWIRYYDDAILVDTWSGQVVDVIYDFFW